MPKRCFIGGFQENRSTFILSAAFLIKDGGDADADSGQGHPPPLLFSDVFVRRVWLEPVTPSRTRNKLTQASPLLST